MEQLVKQPLISVIVPIYKVEKYLRQCIESIINQTYQNLEIILVDDGSPDSCGAICDEYAKQDDRIKVIHKENGGLSDARNRGLDVSTGEYINFVDSDDWIATNAIDCMLKLANQHNADLVIGGTEKISDNTGKVIWSDYQCETKIKVMDKLDAMKHFLENGCAAWGRLYKRKIHENIYFPKGEINEDEAIVLDILNRCDKVVKTSDIVYNYRYREESITSIEFHVNKLIWCEHCLKNLEFVEQNYKELVPYAKMRYYNSLLWSLDAMVRCSKLYKEQIADVRCKMKKVYKEYLSLRKCDVRHKIKSFMLVYMYKVYVLLSNITNKYNI